jgi:hypothetical protein
VWSKRNKVLFTSGVDERELVAFFGEEADWPEAGVGNYKIVFAAMRLCGIGISSGRRRMVFGDITSYTKHSQNCPEVQSANYKFSTIM